MTILVRYTAWKHKCCLLIGELHRAPRVDNENNDYLQPCLTQTQKGCRNNEDIVLLHLTVVENDHARVSVILLLHLVFRVDALPLNLGKHTHIYVNVSGAALGMSTLSISLI